MTARIISEAQLDQAMDMRRKGFTWRDIGKALGVRHQSVLSALFRNRYWFLVEMGGTRSTRPKHHQPRADYIPSQPRHLPTSPRACLACQRQFSSEGRHNRICDRCKDTAGWASPPSYPEYVV